MLLNQDIFLAYIINQNLTCYKTVFCKNYTTLSIDLCLKLADRLSCMRRATDEYDIALWRLKLSGISSIIQILSFAEING